MSRKTKELEIEERRKAIAANLMAGSNYRQIASVLKCSIATVSKDVKVIVKRWQNEQVNTADQWISLQCRRIDAAINAVWGDVLAGNTAAIATLQKLIDQQGRLLGYERPIRLDWKIEVSNLLLSGKLTPEEIEEEIGSELARELFESIGLSIAESRKA